jgi:hypothetical protein
MVEIFVIAVFIAAVTGAVISLMTSSKKTIADRKKEEERLEEPAPDISTVGARVIKKSILDGTSGTRIPKYSMELFIAFLTDDGEVVEYKVEQEAFERIELDQTGKLLTLGGNFFDFGEGEELSEN